MSVKIKVNSVGSQAFHEGALKDILSNIIHPYAAEIVNDGETTCIYADLYKDKLTISISLAGDPLYKRGYRETFNANAPLREDFAACCIQKALDFAKKIHPLFSPKNILIPFSGTGTFAFEYLLNHFHIPLTCFERDYAIQKMSFYKKEYVTQIMQKANDHCTLALNDLTIYCMDNSVNANESLAHNSQRFNHQLIKHHFPAITLSPRMVDFFKNDDSYAGDIVIMLNPPYGIRLAKNSDTSILYKNIAKKINGIANHRTNLLGLILCPSEDAWSQFCNHLKHATLETYHFTQGGLDIRVCQFYTGFSGRFS